MFKLISLVFVLLGLSFAAEAPSTEAKGCKPHNHGCCGCDMSRSKAKVRELTNLLVENFSSPNGAVAVPASFIEDADITLTANFCVDPVGCCTFEPSPIQLFGFIYSNRIEYIIENIETRRDDSIVVDGLFVMSIGSPRFKSYVIRLRITWVPTIGCNWKVASIYGLSDTCQATDLGACGTCGFPPLP